MNNVSLYKKIVTGVIVLLMAFAPSVGIFKVQKAEAQLADFLNFAPNTISSIGDTQSSISETISVVKEHGLDKVAYIIGKKALTKVIGRTIDWANGGFDPNYSFGSGSPFFVENTTTFLKDAADKEVLLFIKQQQSGDNPVFQGAIAKRLVEEYTSTYADKSKFNLDEIIGPNWREFENDFKVGGWNGFIASTQAPQNNSLGAYMIANQELSKRIAGAQDAIKTELDQNGGFLSQKECSAENLINNIADGINYCLNAKVTTTGGIIKDQLTASTTSTIRQMELADEFGETISGALADLVGTLIDKGIAGLSSEKAQVEDALQRELDRITGKETTGTRPVTVNDQGSWSDTPDSIDLDPEKIETTLKEAVIPDLEKEIEIYQDIVATTKNFPKKLYDLDQCLPGPDYNWRVRLNNAVNDMKQMLIRLDGKNDQSLQSFSAEKGYELADEYETVMYTQNIPGVVLMTDMISRTNRFNQEHQSHKEHLSNLLKTQARINGIINMVDNTPEEVVEINRQYRTIQASLPNQYTIDQAFLTQSSVQTDNKNIDNHIASCKQSLQDPTKNYQNVVSNELRKICEAKAKEVIDQVSDKVDTTVWSCAQNEIEYLIERAQAQGIGVKKRGSTFYYSTEYEYKDNLRF